MLLIMAMLVSVLVNFGGSVNAEDSSIINVSDRDINKNLSQFIDSSVMYKLPDTVKDTDEISVIIQTKKASLLDAYEKADTPL